MLGENSGRFAIFEMDNLVSQVSSIESANRVNAKAEKKSSDVDENVLERLKQIESDLFPLFPVYQSIELSKRLRNVAPDSSRVTFCYTEVLPGAFLELIANLKNFDIGFNESSIFIDIGCGIAKNVLLIGVMNVFKRSIGIEINDGLYKKGLELLKAFNKQLRSPIDQTEMELIRGDATYIDWSYASLVYIQATCFDDSMLERISSIANKLFPSSIVIMIGRKLFDELYFDLIGITKVQYVTGELPVFIYRKSSKAPSNHPESLHTKLMEVLNRKIL
jgi:hypothetical protein